MAMNTALSSWLADVANWDARVLLGLSQWHTVPLQWFLAAWTWLGSMWLLLPLLLAYAIWGIAVRRGRLRLVRPGVVLHEERLRAAALPWWAHGLPLLALLGAHLSTFALKAWLMRPRQALMPPLINMPLDSSFPSAHSAQAMAAGLALAWFTPKPGWRAGLGVVVVVVAFSRCYLLVHYPSDVFVGLLLGALWGGLAWWVLHKAATQAAPPTGVGAHQKVEHA